MKTRLLRILLAVFVISLTVGAAIPIKAENTDLPWNTFLGGTNVDCSNDIAVDSSGNIYVIGSSNGTWGNPIRAYSGGTDAFVAKLDSSGMIQWNTFLGGTGNNEGYGIAIDSSDSIYVVGISNVTWGSPIRAYSGNYDAFVAKLDSSGMLAWNTLLGSSSVEYGRSIAVDSSGNVYITGLSGDTWGSPIRRYSGGSDAFVTKLNNSGILEWNTFLGGSDSDGGYGIALDSNTNIYVTGYSTGTWGPPVWTNSGNCDAFVTKINNNGTLNWNTFLGGSDSDIGYRIAVDSNDNIYVRGESSATWGSPIRAFTENHDAFVAKLNQSIELEWNTFLGGPDFNEGFDIAVDSSGNVYVTGDSICNWGDPVRAFSRPLDAYVVKLDNSGVLQWNTFLGGNGDDIGYGIAVDFSDNIYVTGYSDASWGSPVRTLTNPGSLNYDCFIAKLDSSGRLEAPIAPPVPELPAGVLLGTGIMGIGAFILIRRKKATNSM